MQRDVIELPSTDRNELGAWVSPCIPTNPKDYGELAR